MTTKSPIRVFITHAERSKLSYLAGDAYKTPNQIAADLLADAINKQFEQREASAVAAVANTVN